MMMHKPVTLMECTRCRSRHAAHRNARDAEEGRLLGRGRGIDRAHVIREGVSRWTFPDRTPARPLPPTRSWDRSHHWSLQLQHARDYSMPDMEDFVSDELRLRIERILSYPLCPHHGEGSSTEATPSSGRGEASCPAGGLLQEYLDQLGPEEDDDELDFQGSDSDASDADLLYDQEKETYTTPYLLYLQQPRAKRAEQPGGATSLLKDEVEERRIPGREREGAVGRTGHRPNSREPPASPADGQEPPTSPSNSEDPPASSTNSGDLPTSASNSRGPANSASEPPEGPEQHLEASSSITRRAPGDPPDDEKAEDSTALLHEENDDHLTEEEEEEEDEDDAVPSQKTKKTKKKRRRKKRKKRSPQREQAEEEEEGETEEDIQRANLENLKKSVVLSLFRDFAKNVFAREHPDFQLFEGFQETDEAKETSTAKRANES